jgi:toxin ParE1/3/4
MRVRWLPRALQNAAEAAAYIAGDRPLVAERWREGLIKIAERLAQYPESGRAVREWEHAGLREVIYSDFRVIYLIAKVPVIAAIHHCRRRLTKRTLRTWVREAGELGALQEEKS